MDSPTTAPSIQFSSRSFCFTGKLADLKRTQAERETRSRGGFTTDAVNGNLDYLVVGSIPATGWKFGEYGRKIEAARDMASLGEPRLVLVSESSFMDALAQTPPSNAGGIDGKVLVLTYTFVAPTRNAFDRAGVDRFLVELKERHACHVRVRVIPAKARNDLFAGRGDPLVPDGYLVFELRVVKHAPLILPATELVSFVTNGFERLDGVDGKLHWFERAEGSSDYIRLIREIPEDLRVPDL